MTVFKSTTNLGNQICFDEDGFYHRENGPAVIYKCGTEYWLIHGKLHNSNGPAVIEASGEELYFIFGLKIDTIKRDWMKENNIEFPLSNEDLILFTLRWVND